MERYMRKHKCNAICKRIEAYDNGKCWKEDQEIIAHCESIAGKLNNLDDLHV